MTLLFKPPALLHLHVPIPERIHFSLVGCGGTGSHIASGLGAIALALQDLGHQVDIDLYDPDTVEQRNVGRQLFAVDEIGQAKAEVLYQRLAFGFGLRCNRHVRAITAADTFRPIDREYNIPDSRALSIVIGAVDNPAARALIAAAVGKASGMLWWLDCGNENLSGQVVIGNIASTARLNSCAALGILRELPAPHLIYPDLISDAKPVNPRPQSCAELTAAGVQGLMVNRMIAAHACAMLDEFLLRDDLRYFAVAIDLQWGGVKPYMIDLSTLASAIGVHETLLKGNRYKE